MIRDYDDLEIYCRMLGHPLTFSYCRSTEGSTPCRRIIDCWFQRIPVQKYLEENFSDEALQQISSHPRDKVLTILELIEQAEKNRDP